MIPLLLIILTVFLISWSFYKHLTVWRHIESLPGPKKLPLIGNAHQMGRNPSEYLKNLWNWVKEYNFGMYRVWIGSQPYVIVTDPKDVEVILTDVNLTQKGEVYDLLQPWLGDGLLTSYGTKWQKHRKMITPSFHFKILIDFLDVMNENSIKLVQKLEDKANGGIFDVQKMIYYCTLDIICETAMGINLNSMENPKSNVVQAFKTMCYIIQNSAFSLFKRNPYIFKLTEDYRTQQKALKIIKDFTLNVIEQRREILKKISEDESNDKRKTTEENDQNSDDVEYISFTKSGRNQKKAFLDNLLTATIDDCPLTFKEIFEEVSTFMFEGHDTTTSGIIFSIYILSRHKEIQDSLYEEQKSMFGNKMYNVNPTYQQFQDMKNLELLIKETLRLYPSVPIIARYCHKDINLNGKIIPKNTTLTVFLLAMGYNENYFKDAYKVDLNRFDPTIRERQNPFDYVPFSAGPRNCIGQKFAILEMKAILSGIIRNYEILPPFDGNDDLNKKYEPQLATVLILKSENGVQIRLKKRN